MFEFTPIFILIGIIKRSRDIFLSRNSINSNYEQVLNNMVYFCGELGSSYYFLYTPPNDEGEVKLNYNINNNSVEWYMGFPGSSDKQLNRENEKYFYLAF